MRLRLRLLVPMEDRETSWSNGLFAVVADGAYYVRGLPRSFEKNGLFAAVVDAGEYYGCGPP